MLLMLASWIFWLFLFLYLVLCFFFFFNDTATTEIYTLSLHDALPISLVLFFLVVELRYRVHILGSFILPMAFVSLISAAALPKEIRVLEPIFRNVWMHVTLSLLGTVAFAVAFIAGLMYLIQEHMLKSKRSEEHTSELQSLAYLVCRLLLEKKK